MRVLILEPDRWRELGFGKALEAHQGMNPILESELAEQTWSRLDPPTVVLLSEHAARRDPRRSLKRVRTKFPDAKVLIYGEDADPGAIADILAEGADGYFILADGEERLVTAIETVARDAVWGPESAITELVRQVQKGQQRRPALSTEEGALLMMLHDGLTNKEMASRLGVAEVTIKARLARLFRRYGVRTRVQLLTYAMKHHLFDR